MTDLEQLNKKRKSYYRKYPFTNISELNSE